MPKKLPSKRQRGLIVFAMSLAMFVLTFELTAVNVALPVLAHAFQVTLSDLSWVLNTYLISWMLFILPGGRVSDHFGKKRIFIWGLVLFALGSCVAGLAGDYAVLLVGRFLQGIGLAVVAPQTVAISREVYPKSEQGVPVGYVFLGAAFGLSAGPVLGGLILEFIGWRSLFLIFLPLGALVAAVTVRFVAKDTVQKVKDAFVWLPSHYFDIFKNRIFVLGVICRIMTNSIVSFCLMAFPLFLQNIHQSSALFTGLWMVPMSIGFGFGGVLTGQMSKHIPNAWLVVGAGFAMAVGFLLSYGLSVSFSIWYYILASLFLGFGGGGLISSITSLALHKLQKTVAGFSTSFLFMAVSIGNFIGFFFAAAIIAWRGKITLLHYLNEQLLVLNNIQIKGLLDVFSGATKLSHLSGPDQNLPVGITHDVSLAFVSGFSALMLVGFLVSLIIAFLVIVFVIYRDRKSK